MERRNRTFRWARAILITCLTALACAFAATPGIAGAGQGKVDSYTFEGADGDFPYLLYTPSSYSPKKPVPLVMAAHGCMTTADQFMNATQFNQVAEREGFVVAYPDVEQAVADLPNR